MASLSLANISPRGVLYLATLIVAASPFVYELYFILGFPYNPAYDGAPLFMHVLIVSILLAGDYFPFIFIGQSSFLLLTVLYFILILVFLLFGFGLIKITRRRTVTVQRLMILSWLLSYLVVFYVPFFPKIVWP